MSYLVSLIATLSITAGLAVVMAVQAQNPSASPGSNTGSSKDDNAGKQIATSGAPNGVTACATCHGAQGEGNAASNFPRIAGQPQAYLARQLVSYVNGSRNNAIMNPIAKALTQQQIQAVSAYYAGLSAPSPKKPASQAATKAEKRGQILATVGDDKIGVQGCANCHGPAGVGEPPNYPYLASQHNGYLIAALGEWKSDSRKTDPSQQMNIISKRLSDDDIAATAAYYSAQPAPLPATQRINIPSGSAARPAMPAAQPSTNAQPTTSAGTEQGSPTTGASPGEQGTQPTGR
jgi:cytochrome c553